MPFSESLKHIFNIHTKANTKGTICIYELTLKEGSNNVIYAIKSKGKEDRKLVFTFLRVQRKQEK